MAEGSILIVEDEFLIAEMMVETLQAAGFCPCTHAATLDEAMAAASSAGLRGALLDIRLSRELVYPVAEALRDRKVPFAFSSGLGDSAELPEQFKDVLVLQKPWGDGQLEQVARTVFGQ